MPTIKEYYPLLLPGRFFHVFNRGNNGDNLFYRRENYDYFLRKYYQYLSPVLDTYCYCLLPNHFHLLVKIKEERAVLEHRDSISRRDSISWRDSIASEDMSLSDGIPTPDDGIPTPEELAARWASELFRRFFLGYSQAIRKQQGRCGSLFQKNFKRLEVNNDTYFINLILYIHVNPQLHGIWRDFRDYPHSSYEMFSHDFDTPIQRREVLDLFGSYKVFEHAHLGRVNFKVIEPVVIEEDGFVQY